MATKIYSFQKEERLCSKKFLKELFINGSSFLLYPFRVTWLHSPSPNQDFPVQLLTAVPKKRFKSSVDRNTIKRKIKEAYQLDPVVFKQPEGITFTPWGDMLISNEAADVGAPNILIFKYKKKHEVKDM